MTREAKGMVLAVGAAAIAAIGGLGYGAAFHTGDWRWLIVAGAAYLLVRRV